jgi:CheY-like chemotaxis protein
MALRVLLADESTTIRKVMQLALQDYGVEVKSVPIGVDVVPVSRSFKPDIVFVDVLLQKKSGYEVVKDFRQHAEFKHVPVVLMWSGFMELDEAKAADCGADRRLEKPFDAEILRALINELVPKTQENLVSNYLTFPKLPDFQEENSLNMNPSEAPSANLIAGEISGADIYSIPEIGENEAFDPGSAPEEFAAVPLSASGTTAPPEEGWSHQDLSKFQIQVPQENKTGGMPLDQYMIPADDLSMAQVETTGEFEEVTFVRPSSSSSSAQAGQKPASDTSLSANPNKALATSSASDQVMAEKIMREEARAVLEKIAWQIMPEICERVVKEELNKLLKDVERSI